MGGGKEIALLNLWAVVPALMCKPPALQLELVRQQQFKIYSAAPPSVFVGETAPGQGGGRRVPCPSDRAALFPWEVTNSGCVTLNK